MSRPGIVMVVIAVMLGVAVMGTPQQGDTQTPTPPGAAQRARDVEATEAAAKEYVKARANYASVLCSHDASSINKLYDEYSLSLRILLQAIDQQASDDPDVYKSQQDFGDKYQNYRNLKDKADISVEIQARLSMSSASDKAYALHLAKQKSITENVEAGGVDFSTPIARCPPPTGTAPSAGSPEILETQPKPAPPKVPPPNPQSPTPAEPAAPGPPAKNPAKDAADRTHAASDAEKALRDKVLKLSKTGCTLEGLKARKEYDAARHKTDAAIDAEVDVSPEVQAARAELQAAQNAFDKLGPNPDPVAAAAANQRIDKAQEARHDADLKARARIADREHFAPILYPGCPPGSAVPPPPPPPPPPDPDSHSSTMGIRLPPPAHPNTRAGEPDQPASAD